MRVLVHQANLLAPAALVTISTTEFAPAASQICLNRKQKNFSPQLSFCQGFHIFGINNHKALCGDFILCENIEIHSC